MQFAPGNLVKARGREWIVENQPTDYALTLRPLEGADADLITLIPELELEPVESASFDWPGIEHLGNHNGALLLRDAMRLKLRSGAGPFRSFGHIAVEPRAYQLVPLLMALRLTTVRLLIADDVGIGKTIEAGLIVRELMERGELNKLAVLCPPHLVDQWVSELENRFNLPTVALTSASANRLERDLPHGVSLFDYYPNVVVSLDYIKSERHREHFLAIAPECIIVDEAHTSVSSGQGKQLRFELLKRLSKDENRHMILLTATPHSGDEEAFYNLLSILKPDFIRLAEITKANDPLRQELARHFVQRRRKDIEEWQDNSCFPRRMKAEITYQLTGDWGRFYDQVQDYCFQLAESLESKQTQKAPLVWYTTLALLRCVASSPAAAVRTLTTRLEGATESTDQETLLSDDRLHDGHVDDLDSNDLEPPGQLDDTHTLKHLIQQAEKLAGKQGDPKLAVLIEHLKPLIKDGFHPVVFCRYVATAHYVAQHLKKQFPNLEVDAITGEYPPEERKQRVEDLYQADQRLLVATDCLSEGINLQHAFNAVIHYDLAWNPTRHEQREGRVDRFGQTAEEVRCTMLYGQDNPVDGFVLKVILRKGEAIEKELGVMIPMPEDDQRINQALVKAALTKRDRLASAASQVTFDFGEAEAMLAPMETKWQNALAKAKANRTIFAQRSIKPEEVMPEWHKQSQALGTQQDVVRFLQQATARLNAPLQALKNGHQKMLISHLPENLRLRFSDEGYDNSLQLDLNTLHRSHPVIGLLADHLVEETLASEAQAIANRTAVTLTQDVNQLTRVFLLRLRHRLSYVRRHKPYQLMAEETLMVAVQGVSEPKWFTDEDAAQFLAITPSGNLNNALVEKQLNEAKQFLSTNADRLNQLAHQRAQALLEDHIRVREASKDVGKYQVEPALPVDIIGIYILLPDDL
ncbi:helicase-related protein [Thiomicrospira microaerophila]|uniref:helicase-related protein n=1 Tax=Thiomicrospira microaerophila TaxID=406020 RepID=UPI000A951941|nr:helicase-related protein [Thiomicrospira microaerophila]